MEPGQQSRESGSDMAAAAQPGCSAFAEAKAPRSIRSLQTPLSFGTPQSGSAKSAQPSHLIGEVQYLSLDQNKEKETNKGHH